MKKTFLVMAMVIGLALSMMAPAMANGKWDSQVTGGGDFGTFDLAVSSRSMEDGTTKGMVQYTRDDLVFHGVVDCLYFDGAGNIAMSGEAKDQEGNVKEYASVEVRADGLAVRVRSSNTAYGPNCGYSGSYPGALVEGSFNIK